MTDLHVVVGSKSHNACLRGRDLWKDGDDKSCNLFVTKFSTLTYSIIVVERLDLTGSLNMILQASRWCQPIVEERSWASNDFSDVSSWRRFNSVQRSWLTEWTFKLMNRNVPIRTCKSISISRVDCDFKLTLALSRSDRNVNWDREKVLNFFIPFQFHLNLKAYHAVLCFHHTI